MCVFSLESECFDWKFGLCSFLFGDELTGEAHNREGKP